MVDKLRAPAALYSSQVSELGATFSKGVVVMPLFGMTTNDLLHHFQQWETL
jgi:hypothetical protein